VIPTYVFGATGYVGAELMRLVVTHPGLYLAGSVSSSAAGRRVADVLPGLALALPDAVFISADEAVAEIGREAEVAIFLALPHGESARTAKRLLESAPPGRHVVDLSADFRFADPAVYEAWHGSAHPAPDLIGAFFCGHPELHPDTKPLAAAHPGCFTTSVVLPLAPLWQAGLIGPSVQVAGVTGSTGSGREPKPGTHHPERHGNLWAYSPLVHRHASEMTILVEEHGAEGLDLAFVPHSGPFARGIHSTIFAELTGPLTAEDVTEQINAFYGDRGPFVRAFTSPPTVKQVAGTNACRIGVATQGKRLVLASVVDNLLKGAAGGAMQWMNRLVGLPDETGLTQAAPGWM